MSFWGALGTIGGAVLAPITGGASIPIGTAIGQAIDSRNAEKSAAKQQQTAAAQVAGLYDPFRETGLRSAASLASALGVNTDGINFASLPYAPVGGDGVMPTAASQYWGNWDALPSRQTTPAGSQWGQMASTAPALSMGGRLADLAKRVEKQDTDVKSSYARKKDA